MLSRKNKIDRINYELYGEPLDKAIVKKQVNGQYASKLPHQFNYNGSWKVEHNCPDCDHKTSFGLHFNASKSPFPKTDFRQTQYLCSKYYDQSFLTDISKLFANTSLISHENGDYVIQHNSFDSDFPVTSSIQPIFYNCQHCSSDFLGLLRMNAPYSPDRECPEGIIGEVAIDEIIQLEIDSGEQLADLLEGHKK